MTNKKEKIAVLGGGSWGATLAAHLAENGHDVMVWEFVPEVAAYLKKERSLKTLPQLRLPASIGITNDLAEALKNRPVILSVVPSHTVRATFQKCRETKNLEPGALVINASKGIENGTHALMSDIIQEMFPAVGDVVILSGPSHAEEVAAGRPVVLVSASESIAAAERVRDMFISDLFRIYTTSRQPS
jgi:glycerol-3-phosphate dehydrogenase (NAD(P)+)